ncbi:MAG: hypothetical protein EBS54_05520 [Betaproteobacteria bacterium]|nr:hypothetical protein [Betaproteobacteria bacterium]NDE53971.1 hypothetical protein [Actinomycetota bacterium]
MALRKQALEAVLRVARLREQQAAAHAQRERKKLYDAVGAASQLVQFAEEYRSDLPKILARGQARTPELVNTLEFARKLESTAQEQRLASEPQRQLAEAAVAQHRALKLRLDGLEKLERRSRIEAMAEVLLREVRENEDAVASRLYRR